MRDTSNLDLELEDCVAATVDAFPGGAYCYAHSACELSDVYEYEIYDVVLLD